MYQKQEEYSEQKVICYCKVNIRYLVEILLFDIIYFVKLVILLLLIIRMNFKVNLWVVYYIFNEWF